MSVTIEREFFSPALFSELLPLAQKCWEESTATKLETCAFYGDRDFAVEPDLLLYERLSGQGSLVLLLVRDKLRLVGYLVAFLYRSWHHRETYCANVDSTYVELEYRSYAPVLLEKFERLLQELKVQAIGWPVTQGSDIHEFLKASGYVGDDIVMEKRLKCA